MKNLTKTIFAIFVLCIINNMSGQRSGSNQSQNNSTQKKGNIVKQVDNYFADKIKKNYEDQGGYCPPKPKALPVTKTVWNLGTCAKPVY